MLNCDYRSSSATMGNCIVYTVYLQKLYIIFISFSRFEEILGRKYHFISLYMRIEENKIKIDALWIKIYYLYAYVNMYMNVGLHTNEILNEDNELVFFYAVYKFCPTGDPRRKSIILNINWNEHYIELN